MISSVTYQSEKLRKNLTLRITQQSCKELSKWNIISANNNFRRTQLSKSKKSSAKMKLPQQTTKGSAELSKAVVFLIKPLSLKELRSNSAEFRKKKT